MSGGGGGGCAAVAGMDLASPFMMSVTLPAFFSITRPPDGATFAWFETAADAEDFRMLLLEDVGGCWRLLPEDAEVEVAAVVVVVAIVVEAVVVAAAAAVDVGAAAVVVVAAAAVDGVDAAATALFMMGTLKVERGIKSDEF